MRGVGWAGSWSSSEPHSSGRLQVRVTIPSARLMKFAGVGLSCAFVQLLALHLLVVAGVEEHVSNLLAFALSVQVNFLLSQFLTWQDRWSRDLRLRTLVARLLMFNASASSTGLVNQSVFVVANLLTSYIAAATIGIAVAAVLNFTLNDKLVFRKATLKPA